VVGAEVVKVAVTVTGGEPAVTLAVWGMLQMGLYWPAAPLGCVARTHPSLTVPLYPVGVIVMVEVPVWPGLVAVAGVALKAKAFTVIVTVVEPVILPVAVSAALIITV
jgi:hypothetical protein